MANPSTNKAPSRAPYIILHFLIPIVTGLITYKALRLLNFPLALAAFITWGAVVLAIFTYRFSIRGRLKEIAIREAGARGEKQMQRHLSSLPKEFTTLNNLRIRVGNNSAEIDHVIVGPSVLILLETKNMSGDITINPNGWTRVKRGQRENLSSPAAQSRRHEEVIKRLLHQAGIKAPVHSAVAMVHPHASLRGQDAIPVLHAEQVKNWILQLRTVLTQNAVKQLVQFLQKQHIQ
jgi:hypothetical protein